MVTAGVYLLMRFSYVLDMDLLLESDGLTNSFRAPPLLFVCCCCVVVAVLVSANPLGF